MRLRRALRKAVVIIRFACRSFGDILPSESCSSSSSNGVLTAREVVLVLVLRPRARIVGGIVLTSNLLANSCGHGSRHGSPRSFVKFLHASLNFFLVRQP